MKISAYFYDEPSSTTSKLADRIFLDGGGQFMASGKRLAGPWHGERDIQYDVPDENAALVTSTLKEAGYRVS